MRVQHLGEVTAPAVQGTRSIPIPVLAAGWSGRGELLGAETHVSGQPSRCTHDAAAEARDHRHPKPVGLGQVLARGSPRGLSGRTRCAACHGGDLAEAAPLCLLMLKLGLLSWNGFFHPS